MSSILRKLDAACFDMDGVLIQSREVIETAWANAAMANGVTVTERIVREDIHGRPGPHTLRALFGHLSEERQVAIKSEVDSCEERACCPLTPGVAELLRLLLRQRVPLALVTSSWPERIAFVLEQHGLNQVFDAVVHRHDVACGKPDPHCYALAAERLGTAPSRCLVFEDSESGVEAAVRSGATCIGIGDDPGLRDRGAAARCLDFSPGGLQISMDERWTVHLMADGIEVALASRYARDLR